MPSWNGVSSLQQEMDPAGRTSPWTPPGSRRNACGPLRSEARACARVRGEAQILQGSPPGAGSFRCSETELEFEVRAAVTIQYGYNFWDQHLSASEKQQWMVSGPLFNIRVEPVGAVAAVHLPPFLCLRGTADKSKKWGLSFD
ncbi:unnamed protein product [Natator depressus]